jgi:hypothetical protein
MQFDRNISQTGAEQDREFQSGTLPTIKRVKKVCKI